jgi:trigger factor
MKISENKISESKIELSFELDRTDIETDLQASCKRISEITEIPGFRKGSAPYDTVSRHVGGEMKIYEEAIEYIVNRVASKELQEKKYETIGKPDVSIQKIVPPFGVSFKVTISLMPKIELGDPSKIKIKKNEVKLEEADIQKVIDNLLQMRIKEALVDRGIQKGDKALLDFEVKRDGVAIENGKSTDYPLVIGEGKFIPGFEENVIGLKANEEKKFDLEFPKEYYEKSLAGKKAEFNVKIKQVFELEAPKLDDEFVKQLGADYKSVDDLKKQISDNLKLEKQREEDERFQMAAMDELVKISKIGELPHEAVHEEVHKMVHELEQNVAQQGMQFEDYLKSIKKSKEDLEKEFEPKAKVRLKIMLCAREFGNQEKVEISEADLTKEIEITKKAYQNQPETLAKFDSEDYKNYMRNALTSKRIFEKLVEKIAK